MNKSNFRSKNISELFQFALAIYSNTATSSVETLFGVTRKSNTSDPIEDFIQAKLTVEQKVKYWQVMKWNIHFIDWLSKENYWFDTEKEDGYDETAAANFDKAIELLKLLLDIRNKWSHRKHDAPVVKNRELREILLILYNYACMETSVKLPPVYAGERGFFKFIESEKGRVVLPIADGETKKGDFTDELTLTGYIFILSLFLQKHETSSFLEALEQNALSFDQINERRSFREENPGKKYPEHLRAERKYFLYARDIYTHFAIRGHRDTLVNTEEFSHKEQAFGIMEYLKRCPQERLANSVAQNKQDSLGESIDTGIEQVEEESSDRYLDAHKQVKIENETYALREKNKFFEWTIAFLHEEMQKLAVDVDGVWDWKWARHASANKIKEERQQYELKNPLDRLPRHRKMIWELPEQNEYRLNDRQEENGFPFFFERDKMGNYNHAIFKLENKKKHTSLIGKLGADMLCTLMENYFERFPLNEMDYAPKSKQMENKRKFFRQFFEAVSSQIQQKSDTGKGNTERNSICSDRIRKRIAFLRQENEETACKIEAVEEKNKLNSFNPDRYHDKISFIAKTWNKMLTYGQTNNLAHAADYEKSMGGKNGYQEIIRQLALLATADTTTREEIRNELFKLLQKLGNRSQTNYYQAINAQIKSSGIMGNSGSPFPLKKSQTLHDFYLQAQNYYQAMLDKFEKRLNGEFNVDEWRPNAEMRWMGLRDTRTPQASNQKQKSPENLDTGIYNIDKHFYAAVGVNNLPFIKAGMPTNMEVSDNLKSRHNDIYPSPNGNCLLIEEFYAFDGWEDLSRTNRGRLYRIRRQDCLLSHLAYHYTRLYEGDYKDRTLQSLDFQKDAINIPVTLDTPEKDVVVNISMYYRHYKQNRYRMIPRRTEKILRLLWEQQILLAPQIAFNALHLKAKDELNKSERFAFLSTEDQKMRWFEKNEKAKRKLAAIKETYLLIPIAPEDREPFYLSEILNGYELCRRAFVARILKTEGLCIKLFSMSPKEKAYIPFSDITEQLFENNYLSKQESEDLNQLRNCALHGDVPTGDLLPIKEDLLQRTREGDKSFIDFFGKGMRLMNKLNEKLYSLSHVD